MRKQVEIFAKDMEKTLRKNDYKGGWDEDNLSRWDFLQQKLMEEVAEYFRAFEKEPGYTAIEVARDFSNHLIRSGNEIHDTTNGHSKKQQMKELVDIANICMMLHDNLKKSKEPE